MSEARLDKLVSETANKTRSASRALIRAGRVAVDGTVVKSPDMKLGEGCRISLDGKTLEVAGKVYIMMHKPAGVVSATQDRREKTVADLLPEEFSKRGVFPVGRLDKDATGLLVLTDDGDFAHRATHPKKHVPKLYEIFTAEPLTTGDVAALSEGLRLSDGTSCLPAGLEIDPQDSCHGFLEIHEGKYHQIKRMIASRGNAVTRLHRASIGGLVLDAALKPGESRIMTEAEAAMIVTKE